ncbi:hypothetical protein DFJ77DRAFT_462238 [Powellomyces hirtus]|nr:hypothetical protein DFJ77DRAFT_462238 [Powellomyces hirtus]
MASTGDPPPSPKPDPKPEDPTPPKPTPDPEPPKPDPPKPDPPKPDPPKPEPPKPNPPKPPVPPVPTPKPPVPTPLPPTPIVPAPVPAPGTTQIVFETVVAPLPTPTAVVPGAPPPVASSPSNPLPSPTPEKEQSQIIESKAASDGIGTGPIIAIVIIALGFLITLMVFVCFRRKSANRKRVKKNERLDFDPTGHGSVWKQYGTSVASPNASRLSTLPSIRPVPTTTSTTPSTVDSAESPMATTPQPLLGNQHMSTTLPMGASYAYPAADYYYQDGQAYYPDNSGYYLDPTAAANGYSYAQYPYAYAVADQQYFDPRASYMSYADQQQYYGDQPVVALTPIDADQSPTGVKDAMTSDTSPPSAQSPEQQPVAGQDQPVVSQAQS